jgi:hypothetical protein
VSEDASDVEPSSPQAERTRRRETIEGREFMSGMLAPRGGGGRDDGPGVASKSTAMPRRRDFTFATMRG